MYETEKQIMNIDNLISLFNDLSIYELDCIYFHKYFDCLPFEECEEIQEDYKNICKELISLKDTGVKNLIYEEEIEHEVLPTKYVSIYLFNVFNKNEDRYNNIYCQY